MVSGVLSDIIKPYDHKSMEIEHWLNDLDNGILALYGDETSDARRCACLSTFIGDEGKTVINNLTEEKKDTYDNLKQALLDHYQESINVTVEHHKFNNMKQDAGELVDLFITKLRTQALKCKFSVRFTYTAEGQQHAVDKNISDEFIRDRLVCGIYDQPTRAKLLRERNLTLDSAIEIIKAVETANSHVKNLFKLQGAQIYLFIR